jgi:hypothetical protein
MWEVVIGSALGIVGALAGAVVAHILAREQSRQSLDLERAKVFAAARLEAYVSFRRLAEQATSKARRTVQDPTTQDDAVLEELRAAELVLDAVGDPEVVAAARRLRRALEESAERFHAETLRAVTMAVRVYVNAVRTSLGQESLAFPD